MRGTFTLSNAVCAGLCSTASIVYETFLFGLMMMGVLRGGKDGFGDATLLDIVVRDGTAAFLGVFSEYRLRFDSSSCSNQSLQWPCF